MEKKWDTVIPADLRDFVSPAGHEKVNRKFTQCTPVSRGGRWGRMIYEIIHGTTRNMYGKLRILAHVIIGFLRGMLLL